MNSDALSFLTELGKTIGKGLSNIIIPGTNWSVLSFFLGVLLLGFCIRLLFSFFSALDVSGGFESAARTVRSSNSMKRRKQSDADRAERRAYYESKNSKKSK